MARKQLGTPPIQAADTATKAYVDTSLEAKLDTGGTAAAATKLATARTLTTDLAASGGVAFDGTGNATIGVTGSLPQASVTNLTTDLAAKVNVADVAVAGGVASLDNNGKVPGAQLPNSIMTYEGLHDVESNYPALADGVGNAAQAAAAAAADAKAVAAQTLLDQKIIGGSSITTNPTFEDTTQYLGDSTFTYSTDQAYVGTRSAKFTSAGSYVALCGTTNTSTSFGIPCAPGQVYYMEVRVRGHTNNVQTGTTGIVLISFFTPSGLNVAAEVGPTQVGKGSWYKLSGYVTIPAGVTHLTPRVDFRAAISVGEIYYLDSFRVVDVTDAYAAKLAADAAQATAIADGKAVAGSVYRVSVGGVRDYGSGAVELNVGDYLIYSGSVWEKADTTDAVSSVNGKAGSVTLTQDDVASGTTNKVFTAGEQSKLAGVEAGATANSPDATLLARGNHTGTQLASTISNFASAADARVAAAVGVTVQAYDADLTTWAGKTAPSGTVVGTTDSQTLSGKTLSNPTVTNFTESVVAVGTVASAATLSLTNGTVQTATLTASTACTFTMPTAAAGKSFVLLLKQDASTGNGSAVFTGVKWAGGSAPTVTATAGRMDIFSFVSDGASWYGSVAQNFTP